MKIYEKIKYVDTEAPKLTMTIPTKQFTNSGTATAKVTINDRTEVDLANCKWVINSTSDEIGTDSSLYTDGTFESTTQTISKELTAGGSYYFHILVTDVIGNAKEYVSEVITVKVSVVYLDTQNFAYPGSSTWPGTKWSVVNSLYSTQLTTYNWVGYAAYVVSNDTYNFENIDFIVCYEKLMVYYDRSANCEIDLSGIDDGEYYIKILLENEPTSGKGWTLQRYSVNNRRIINKTSCTRYNTNTSNI